MRRGLVWSLVFMIGVAVLCWVLELSTGHLAPTLGLDLKGGVSVVLKPQRTATTAQLDEAVKIIDNRVNGLGVSNSAVQVQGHDVVINLPGIKNSAQALKVLGETAVLYFRPVYCEIPNYVAPAPAAATTTVPSSHATTKGAATKRSGARTVGHSATTTALLREPGSTPGFDLTAYHLAGSGSTSTTVPAAGRTPPSKSSATTTPATTIVPTSGQGTTPVPVNAPVSQADCNASNQASLPTTQPANDVKSNSVILPSYDKSVRYVLGPADMSGNVISNTSVIAPTNGGGFQVQVTFTGSGATQFDKIAAQRYPYYAQNKSNPPAQSQEAIELDGVVQSAPVIEAASYNGIAEINGSNTDPFTQSQASQLALVLKYGSLPVRFVPQSTQTVSATIGKDTLRAGLFAGVGGLILVMCYMLFYYRALGLVVLVGLGVGGSILYGILILLSQSNYHLTLTLAGVTGIIVSIGITVDSYVVYFERLKDEVRAGRTVRQSVERSFARAFRTVFTADLVSFMAAVILYLFTVGDVKGFAFTLGLSTLLDIVTAFMFIRPAVILVGRRRSFTEAPVFGISRGLGARAIPREA